MIKRFILLAVVLFIANISFATIEKSDTIKVDETWSEDTVKVISDIVINDSITLIINPGVYVEFQGHYFINVKGRILAQGIQTDSIKFDILSDSVETGWNGIIYNNTPSTNDSSKFEFCYFTNSKRKSNGGVFYIKGFSKINICNCRFNNNRVHGPASYQGGGAIYMYYTNLTINNCSFVGNGAAYSNFGNGGGAIYSKYSKLHINNCFFNNNGLNTDKGGVVRFQGGNFSITNCLFDENRASLGGGAIQVVCGSKGKIVNCNFVNNQSGSGSNFGGSAINIDGSFGVNQIEIINSIFWKNQASDGYQIFVEDNNLTIKNSCVENGENSICLYGNSNLKYEHSNIEYDPEFIDFANGDLNLRESSLLINGGTIDTTGLNIPSIDLNQNTRIANGRIDVGVYEFQEEPLPRALILNRNSKEFIRYDSLFLLKLEVLSYPELYEYTYIKKPDGMIVENDTIKWIPTKEQAAADHEISIKIENSETSHTFNFIIHVLDDNEFVELHDSNIVWDFDTVKVFNSLTVKNERTLFIKPNTYIEFQGFYNINIQGRLYAKGKSDSLIIFNSKDPNEQNWNGIKFENVSNENDTSVLEFCVFTNSYSYKGGAIYIRNNAAKLKFLSCDFINNIAEYKGGGISCEGADVLFINCKIKNNTVEPGYVNNGHGIFLENTIGKIVNSIISNNGDYGININNYIAPEKFVVSNTLIIDHDEYGICVHGSPSILTNSIVWGNAQGIYDLGYHPIVSYCNIQDEEVEGEGNICQDPNFVNSTNKNYRLNYDSPCINAGNPAWTNDSIASFYDMCGNKRIEFGTIDIGPYEYIDPKPYIEDTTINIDENVNNDTIIYSIPVYYYDTLDIEISLLSGNELNAFSFDPVNYELSVLDSDQIDSEINPEFNLLFKVTNGVLTDSALIHINVINYTNFDNHYLKSLKDFNIYPNPSDGNFTVDFNKINKENINVKVINSQGQIIYEDLVNQKTNIDLASNPKGIYFLIVESSEYKKVKKIILK